MLRNFCSFIFVSPTIRGQCWSKIVVVEKTRLNFPELPNTNFLAPADKYPRENLSISELCLNCVGCLVREIIVVISLIPFVCIHPACAGLHGIYINSVAGRQTAHTVLCTKILSYLDVSPGNVMYCAGTWTVHHTTAGKTRRYGQVPTSRPVLHVRTRGDTGDI